MDLLSFLGGAGIFFSRNFFFIPVWTVCTLKEFRLNSRIFDPCLARLLLHLTLPGLPGHKQLYHVSKKSLPIYMVSYYIKWVKAYLTYSSLTSNYDPMVMSMKLLLDGNFEHVAHLWWKTCLWKKRKIKSATEMSIITNALNRSNNPFHPTHEHLYLSIQNGGTRAYTLNSLVCNGTIIIEMYCNIERLW